MNTDSLTEAQYLLRKTLTLYGRDLALHHPWWWEVDRWEELVFALLVQVLSSPEDRVREIVGHLADLRLLDISALASISTDGKQADVTTSQSRHFVDFLQEAGFSETVAESALTTICQAALAIQVHYGGKLQRYLRSYGELMLEDLDRIFEFSNLTDAETRDAFTYWLQNVLNMPLSLVDKNVHEYCQTHGLTLAQLIEAADEIDLNLAFLDDLVALWVECRPSDAKAEKTG